MKYPDQLISVNSGELVEIRWMDQDFDDDATIWLAYDVDDNKEPWAIKGKHTWIAVTSEDLNGNNGAYVWDTSGLDPGTYTVWTMIFDSKNVPDFSRAPGLIHIESGGLEHDLSISELQIDNLNPQEGDVIEVKAFIHSDGSNTIPQGSTIRFLVDGVIINAKDQGRNNLVK